MVKLPEAYSTRTRIRRTPNLAGQELTASGCYRVIPWNGSIEPEPKVAATPRDPLKLARYYQSLLDSGKFENRAALARYLGVSRARVTQVLLRLN